MLGSFTDSAPYTSDYTGTEIYYRSIQQREVDFTIGDYLWRWGHRLVLVFARALSKRPAVCRPSRAAICVRTPWPDHPVREPPRWYARASTAPRLPPKERVVQDVEIPIERTEEFLRWFLDTIPIEPIWLCPLRLHEAGHGVQPGRFISPDRPATMVNVGFLVRRRHRPRRRDGDVNRAIQARVHARTATRVSHSDAHYEPDAFWALYGGEDYTRVEEVLRPTAVCPISMPRRWAGDDDDDDRCAHR